MCVSGHTKVYDFSVSIERGRYHMAGLARLTTYTTYQVISQLFSPTQLVRTGIVTPLCQ